MEIFK